MSRNVSFEMGAGGFNSLAVRIVRMSTTDALASITVAGWYKQPGANSVEALQPSDLVAIAHDQGTSSAATKLFTVGITNGVVTLTAAY